MDARPSTTAKQADAHARTGLMLGIGAYGLWGLLPIYFKLIAAVPAVAIVAHRIVWSMVALGLLVAVTRGWRQVRQAVSHGATARLLLLTSMLIATNWLIYVYAVNSGHILAGSLGYYLNPLANILLGRFVLKEPLSRLQWLAVAIAAIGVSVLAAGALSHLWISLTLCISFALYGLLRKIAKVEATAGLTIETGFLLLPAAGWLLWTSGGSEPIWGRNTLELGLLLLAGVASTVPLLLFTAAARRLRYSTLGILQFLAPTLQFLVAVFLYGEEFSGAHAIAFGAIWTAATLYLISSLKQARPPLPE
ncbi:EamA family transporter RarD [Sphingomonas arenae]|uniref:EamA family transporter RarD n=1 Tax=Sphingomonas arenae TaxID=2812555 RepID=UPI00196766D7|nr:EamA family transporter RarD [Sphingomonas arenae]